MVIMSLSNNGDNFKKKMSQLHNDTYDDHEFANQIRDAGTIFYTIRSFINYKDNIPTYILFFFLNWIACISSEIEFIWSKRVEIFASIL